MFFVNSTQALATHRMLPGASALTRRSEYFVPERHDGLECYLAEFTPGTEVRPHFHVQDQFQLFVWGDGRLGQHELLPYVIHYVDKFSPYGPLTVGDSGLAMFTLRRGKDTGAQFMPESKSNLRQYTRPSASRHLVARATLKPLDTLRLGSSTEISPLFDPHPDGLAAFLVRSGPNAPIEVPRIGGAGQVWIICNGSLHIDSSTVPLLSMMFLSRPSDAVSMRSGAAGLDALVAQFPEGAGRATWETNLTAK